jgi:phytoene dehydrogenase-like protein
MTTSIIIVGAGIAGLSTGCYASMNGFKTTVFEMHSIPGGLCTAWKRKGYTFDISMHMLTGSKAGPLHRMWQELGVLQDQAFHYHQEMARIESKGKTLAITTDPRELEAQLLALSPADAQRTKAFIRLFAGRDMMGAMSLKPMELTGMLDKLRMGLAIMPLLGTLRRYGKTTIQDFALGFKDPFLRNAIRFFIDAPGWPMPGFPMVAMAGALKSAVVEAGVPLGGSQKVVFKMADNLIKLGGDIHYKSRVTELLIEKDQAVGVRLADNSEHRADVVVWAGDGHTLIFDMLGGRYVDAEISHMYKEWQPVLPMVHVMMGVNRDLSKEPHRIIFELEKPITLAGEKHSWMCFLHHCFDPGMAPAGKSAAEVWYATRYDYWAELAKDKGRYDEEKKRIAEETIAVLDKRWPGFKSQIEIVDVPTPATYHRYTGNWQGSPDGWYTTPENMGKQTMLKCLPGLSGLHMVGHWTAPFCGTVMSALSGRRLIQWLCHEGNRPFLTSGLLK